MATKATKTLKIWIARVELAYEVMGTGMTRPEAIAVASKAAASWLTARGETDHGRRWTAKGVEDYFGVATYHVPLGGAVVGS